MHFGLSPNFSNERKISGFIVFGNSPQKPFCKKKRIEREKGILFLCLGWKFAENAEKWTTTTSTTTTSTTSTSTTSTTSSTKPTATSTTTSELRQEALKRRPWFALSRLAPTETRGDPISMDFSFGAIKTCGRLSSLLSPPKIVSLVDLQAIWVVRGLLTVFSFSRNSPWCHFNRTRFKNNLGVKSTRKGRGRNLPNVQMVNGKWWK